MRTLRWDLPSVLLVGIPFIALIPKYFLIAHTLGPAGTQVFDTGFGFGDYIRNLLTDGSFRSCTTSPFVHCGAQACNYATRMPGLPLIYAALAKLVGLKSAAVAYAKCALSAAAVAAFLVALIRDARPSLLAVLLIAGAYLGPQALKHGATLEYEEGLLVDLELCLAVAAAYLLRPSLTTSQSKRTVMALAAIAISVLMYFIKTTALLTLLVVLGLVVSAQLHRFAKPLAVLCVLAPFLLWGAHNHASSGTAHFSSSWNGENLYRGSNSEGLALYPDILLDRLFDSTQATLGDGSVIQLGNLSSRACFVDEWAWNEYYGAQALNWIKDNPASAFRFQLHKLWVVLFELRHTPQRTLTSGGPTEYPAALTAAMFVWMAGARLVFFTLVFVLIRGLRDDMYRSLWTLGLLAAGWAPYLLVFGYERHLVPLLAMAAALLALLYLVEPGKAVGHGQGLEPGGTGVRD